MSCPWGWARQDQESRRGQGLAPAPAPLPSVNKTKPDIFSPVLLPHLQAAGLWSFLDHLTLTSLPLQNALMVQVT